jgi:hypothetical protein
MEKSSCPWREGKDKETSKEMGEGDFSLSSSACQAASVKVVFTVKPVGKQNRIAQLLDFQNY